MAEVTMTIAFAPRELAPDIALAVAAGMATMREASEAERSRLADAVAAFDRATGPAALNPFAQAMRDAARAWLDGTGPMQALMDAVAAYCAPFAAERVRASARAPGRPLPTGTTHAARVAEAADPLDLLGETAS